MCMLFLMLYPMESIGVYFCWYVTCRITSALVSKSQISIRHICLILKLALYKCHIIIIIIGSETPVHSIGKTWSNLHLIWQPPHSTTKLPYIPLLVKYLLGRTIVALFLYRYFVWRLKHASWKPTRNNKYNPCWFEQRSLSGGSIIIPIVVNLEYDYFAV